MHNYILFGALLSMFSIKILFSFLIIFINECMFLILLWSLLLHLRIMILFISFLFIFIIIRLNFIMNYLLYFFFILIIFIYLLSWMSYYLQILFCYFMIANTNWSTISKQFFLTYCLIFMLFFHSILIYIY